MIRAELVAPGRRLLIDELSADGTDTLAGITGAS